MMIIALATFERAAKKSGLTQREREGLILMLEHAPFAGDVIRARVAHVNFGSRAKVAARVTDAGSSPILAVACRFISSAFTPRT
jgi:hypothetical protein